MGQPKEPVTLTPEQVEAITRRLSDLRHNVNNHLSLVIAAVELLRCKPDLVARMADTIGQQPEKIINEVQNFSAELQQILNSKPN